MPTRQQIRASAHQQRRKPQPVAEITPAIAPAAIDAARRNIAGLRRMRDAVDAYETDMAAAWRVRQDTIDEARDDCQRKCAAAEAEYDRTHDAIAAAYEQRTADSHKPEPDEPDETGEPDVHG